MSTESLSKFWARVDKSAECWVWMAHRSPEGYGRFYADGRAYLAHRWIYGQLVAEIPTGLTIDHLCRNPSCVNPEHLEPVTMRENILRGECNAAKNARRKTCKEGHPFERKPSGRRFCPRCERDHRMRKTPSYRLGVSVGWAEAIAALRDREVWRADDPHDEFGTGQFVVLTAAADYLADQAPKETDHA